MKKMIDLKVQDQLTFKECFAKTMEELLDTDPDVVYLDADLMNSFGTLELRDKYPDRAIDCGIQEANMVGVAAGMSSEGKKPYVHTFGAFAGRRCFDQMFMSVGYAKNNVRIIGSDPGVLAMYNGGTHMPFEDVGLYRVVPESAILEPCDISQFVWALKATKDRKGVTYIRANRKGSVKIYPDTKQFTLGKAEVLKDGSDAAIFAVGIMVAESLKAAYELEKEGISVAVIDLVSIKPLDVKTIGKYARKTGCVVTCENSNIRGGVYSAVCEAVAETHPVPVEWIGNNDKYGEVGTLDYLMSVFGMNSEDIIEKVKAAIFRK